MSDSRTILTETHAKSVMSRESGSVWCALATCLAGNMPKNNRRSFTHRPQAEKRLGPLSFRMTAWEFSSCLNLHLGAIRLVFTLWFSMPESMFSRPDDHDF
ncbi:MAG: hypothetical protein ACRD3S_20525, partial [Terracidiphilus sp.]